MSGIKDRRVGWTPPPRPEWLATLNMLGDKMDARAVVPLDEQSLCDWAMKNTGLSDFGEDGWRNHFRVLLDAVDKEAKLTLFGRLLSRSDLLVYLEQRLKVTEEYKRHPEIDREVIKEPVFIIGFGRSGTTILQETLSQDPQFRTVRRWEGLFPVPSPEKETYETDPRILRSQNLVDLVHTASPEWKAMHAWGANHTAEDIEFTYAGFLSEVYGLTFRIPSYEKYFATQDVQHHFAWHEKLLKLLQWKFKGKHWLLKNPTHLHRIPQLLQRYPDAKFIFTHRDPITTTDSVIHVQGNVFYWRTDDPLGGGLEDAWLQADTRAHLWDDVMSWIEQGIIKKGAYSNFIYKHFMEDSSKTIEKTYRELGLDVDPAAFAKMKKFLDERHEGSVGNSQKYEKTKTDDPAYAAERAMYKRYQDFFGVPNEARE